MTDSRQRIILKVFRQHGHSMGPEAIEFIEDLLYQHDIADEDVESSTEWIAKEYSRQDDASMKVSLDILRRVYESFQNGGDTTQGDDDFLYPENHLHFIDAYEMPLWNWSTEKGTFERAVGPLTASGSADARIMAVRNRLHIPKQTALRNENFSPSTLPSRDKEHLLTIRSTKHLLGRPGERFLLFGLLAHNKEGKLCLEDDDGIVELDLSELSDPSEGLFTEGCFAMAEGFYTDNDTFQIIALGHPPCETRATARSIYGHIDFLGKGATTLAEDAKLEERIRTDLPDMRFFVLSDVWLDHPETMIGLRKMLDNCEDNSFIPKVIVLCGNFSSRGIAQGNAREIRRYQENFDALADLISRYPVITRTTHFVFVPGPLDITINSVLPRKPLLSSFTARLKAKVSKIHFATNPCRIKFCDQEIVIFREDLMSRMMRSLLCVKTGVTNEELKLNLIQTLIDQSHLMPLPNSVQPVIAEYDHALRLYPAPTAVVLADKYGRYSATYEKCHVFNPGSFIGNSFGFSAYIPSQRESEECTLSMDNDE